MIVTGLCDGKVAIVVVLHHQLADGIGGLAMLGSLVDSTAAVSAAKPLECPPSLSALAHDALSSRLRALTRFPALARAFPRSMRSAGGLHPPIAAPCSLLRRTGSHRRIETVRVDLEPLRGCSSREPGTVNDSVLTAVAGALGALLRNRGETAASFQVAVPIPASRRSTSAAAPGENALGNHNSPLVVQIIAAGDLADRLVDFGPRCRAARAGPRHLHRCAACWPLFRVLRRQSGAFRGVPPSSASVPHRCRRTAGSRRWSPSPAGRSRPSCRCRQGTRKRHRDLRGPVICGTLTVTAIADPGRCPTSTVRWIGSVRVGRDRRTAGGE